MKNVTFSPFSTIKRADDRAYLKGLLREGLADLPCVVQEKIHGANFSMWTDGHAVRAAKRTAFLKPTAAFFSFQAVLDSHQGRLRALFSALHPRRSLAVFGELYGGGYPHPAVSAVDGTAPVQKGVFYRPDIAFCAFDILLDGRTWMPVDAAQAALEGAGFEQPPVLYAGPLSRCALFPVGFDSHIPARLGLPPLETNTAEGIIIRAAAARAGRERLLLKKKPPRWQESDPKRAKKRSRKTRKLSPAGRATLEQGEALICRNRLYNVVSKHGRVREGDARRLSVALYRDALEELGLEATAALSRQEQHRIDMALRSSAADLVAECFFTLLEP